MIRLFIFLILSFLKPIEAKIMAGKATTLITPFSGSSSAGFSSRMGIGIEEVAKDLEASALFLNIENKKMIFCCVDHLGITDKIYKEICRRVRMYPKFENVDVYVFSSHTHSGEGGFVEIPVVGRFFLGKYDEFAVDLFIDRILSVIISSAGNLKEVSFGIGCGIAPGLSVLRGPLKEKKIGPSQEVCVIKLNDTNNNPFAVIFNYASHPVIKGQKEMSFSPDWVGYARDYIKDCTQGKAQAFFINGAQGDVSTVREGSGEEFCRRFGEKMGRIVMDIYQKIETKNGRC